MEPFRKFSKIRVAYLTPSAFYLCAYERLRLLTNTRILQINLKLILEFLAKFIQEISCNLSRNIIKLSLKRSLLCHVQHSIIYSSLHVSLVHKIITHYNMEDLRFTCHTMHAHQLGRQRRR